MSPTIVSKRKSIHDQVTKKGCSKVQDSKIKDSNLFSYYDNINVKVQSFLKYGKPNQVVNIS